MRLITRCSGGDRVTCREPTHQIVADVSPQWGGQASIGALELRPSGGKTVARQTGRTLHGITKTITEKEETP